MQGYRVHINPTGSLALHECLPAPQFEVFTRTCGKPVKEYPQFEAALCLLPVLPPDEALALLRQRLTRIEATAAELQSQAADPAVQNLPPLFLVENEYRLALVKAEQRFISELITRIESGWGPLELWRSFHQNREATMTRLYREYGGGPMTQ